MAQLDDSHMQGKAQEVQRAVAEAEAEAVSENSAVHVVAGPGGQIKDLDLRHNAFQMSGVELGEMIAATIKDATRKADAEMSAIVSGILGTEVTEAASDSPADAENEGDRR